MSASKTVYGWLLGYLNSCKYSQSVLKGCKLCLVLCLHTVPIGCITVLCESVMQLIVQIQCSYEENLCKECYEDNFTSTA